MLTADFSNPINNQNRPRGKSGHIKPFWLLNRSYYLGNNQNCLASPNGVTALAMPLPYELYMLATSQLCYKYMTSND